MIRMNKTDSTRALSPPVTPTPRPASLAPPAELPAPSGEKPEAAKVQESRGKCATRSRNLEQLTCLYLQQNMGALQIPIQIYTNRDNK